MISLAWHHGFRPSELIDLKWSDIDLKGADIAVTRLKNGKHTRHSREPLALYDAPE